MGGLPATVDAWLEDGDGRAVARAIPSNVAPGERGFRFRPRCDRQYRLVLQTGDGWNGSATFLTTAAVVDGTSPSPWLPIPAPSDPPPPIPDADADGVWDEVDTCPQVADPTNVDADLDGFGDACDVCPATANPDQLSFEFEPIFATSKTQLSWTTPVDYDYAVGPLDDVANLTTWLTG
ncbi:MAG TPA: thrombospondin type 3 repeat-containing protein, partial [Candidatus Polarisedimenticolaceae bacterium]|nr:thrombospondin type 3 repeat-containing protein [Candidatus Polarisedimenticolaceae bacterium]